MFWMGLRALRKGLVVFGLGIPDVGIGSVGHLVGEFGFMSLVACRFGPLMTCGTVRLRP